MYINGEYVKTGKTSIMSPPHDHQHTIGKYHIAEKSHVELAIDTALKAKENGHKWNGNKEQQFS